MSKKKTKMFNLWKESIGSNGWGCIDELTFHLSSLASFDTNKFYIDSRVLLEFLEPLTSGLIPRNLQIYLIEIIHILHFPFLVKSLLVFKIKLSTSLASCLSILSR